MGENPGLMPGEEVQAMSEYVLEMEGITKIYPNGFVANQDVDLFVKKGEIHALVGENGAGKSTLMKVLFGAEKPEQGKIRLRGKEVNFNNPIEAIKAGVGMVYQHFMLVNELTVAENVVLGLEPTKFGLIDFKEAERKTREISRKYNLGVDPEARVMDLSIGQKQKVEILKSLYRNAEVLILDEPTAVLTPQETRELFVQLKQMKETGLTVIFISHKLKEIVELCDRLTVLRKGRSVASADVHGITEREISNLMIGKEVKLGVEKKQAQPGKTCLQVKDLVVCNDEGKNAVDGVSFRIRGGEILGVAGVEGNGQSELAMAVSGLTQYAAGEIRIMDTDIRRKKVRKIRQLGFSHIPEDRMVHGVAVNASIYDNLISDRFYQPEYSGKSGLLKGSYIKDSGNTLIKDYLVKCDSGNDNVSSLSGGNMQKVVVARECSSSPKVLLANQPTRGIDVLAADFVRHKLVELRDAGAAILLISADLDEVLEVSDSIIVMHNGKIAAYLPDAGSATSEELGMYMLGLKHQTPEEVGGAAGE